MQDFLSRSSLLWLLAALVSSLLLHAAHLPAWILITAFVTIGWRLFMHSGRVSAPQKWIKLVLVVGSFGGVYLSYGKDFSLESMVALFSIGAVLKPLEVSTHRDTYVLIFLCYFLAAVEFLFDQNPETALAVIAALLLTMSAQISLNLQSAAGQSAQLSESQPIKLASKIFIQSIPLAIILFIFVPRVAPLWSLNVKTHSAKTGLAESMTPGDIAKLGASDELAFIATFDGEVPANEKLYWRALTMDKFDGETWKPSLPFGDTEWVTPQTLLGNQLFQNKEDLVSYSVLVEPHEQKWLFALDRAYPQTSNTGLTQDFRVESRYRILNKLLYHIESNLDEPLYKEPLSRVERYQYTHLPIGDNQQARSLAAQLQMSVKSDRDYINAVTQYYLSKPFVYTLKPDLLGDEDTIDRFLFETQNGFCAHYASSFTYLMRLAGIPSRIVTGYQGGEFNEAGGYLAVYQYNAHAWVEVWLDDIGWYRIDPTTFVAPERVVDGIEEALEEEFADRSAFSSRNWYWLNKMRLKMEELNFYWNIWVLSYDQKKQKGLIEQLFGDVSLNSYGMILLSMVMGAIGVLAMYLYWSQRPAPLPPLESEYQRLRVGLNKKGFETPVGLSPNQLFRSLTDNYPDQSSDIQSLSRLFDAYLYGVKSDHFNEQDRRLLKGRVIKLLSQLK